MIGDGRKTDLIASLNDDLAGEMGAVIQYLTYAAKASGPFRPELAPYFTGEIADETAHAQYLAGKIVALGGEPMTTPRPVPPAHTNRAMLEAVLAAEHQAIRDYTTRLAQAEAYGDVVLRVQSENQIADETGHAEKTERILRDWPV
ncbi:MAG: ferritin-like domain-containing protein [Chloroflexi bacterium]|nr:ferritin-like domain-containing protein [Chloroflexota bacterium]